MKPISVTIGTDAVMISPPRFLHTPPAYEMWNTGEVVVNGDIRRTPEGRIYWCVVGGTCVTKPTAFGGNTENDSGLIWQHILAGERVECNIINTGLTKITVAIGYIPVAGAGPVLTAQGSSMNTRSPVAAIYAISDAGGGTVGLQDS